MLYERKILLIISGGIAAYKTLELIRLLKTSGAQVVPVLTRAAQEFVTPLSVAALCGHKVYCDLFDLTDETEIGHIQLSRSADRVIVAPATANMMAKMATGQADDLASTLLLATDTPIMIAPAMNVKMWQHRATQRNIKQLKMDGVSFIGPDVGDMACGEYGPGRMSDPGDIFAAIEASFTAKDQNGDLTGRRVLITSGPTHEPIDPVRYIANQSSGIQGTAIAQACIDQGADVTFITGPAQAKRPENCNVVEVTTARQMHSAVMESLPADVAIMAAAVADFRTIAAKDQKIKKDKATDTQTLNLIKNPDILAQVCALDKNRPALVIGFAAETQNVIENAVLKRAQKGCEWIIANDVSAHTHIMGGQDNDITLITQTDHHNWPRMSKQNMARKLVKHIALALK